MREELLGKQHMDVATSCNDLAYILAGQAKYANAEELYQRAWNIIEESYGKKHPEFASINSNLAWVLFKQVLATFNQAEHVRPSTNELKNCTPFRSIFEKTSMAVTTLMSPVVYTIWLNYR